MDQTKSNAGKWVWGIIIIIILIVIFSLSGGKKETGPIKIGVITPLSGDTALYGEVVRNSIELAVKDINLSGGINGRQIQTIYEDSKCSGKEAATAAQKLVNIDKVKYIIGDFCSGGVLSEIPITDPAKVFVISPSASAPKLSGISKYFVRNSPSDSITGIILADYLLKMKYKSVAIISEQTDYAQGIRDVFIAQAQKDNLTVTANENFVSGVTDFRSQLSKIKIQNPDVLFINPQSPVSLVQIAEQARVLGIKSQFVGSLGGTDPNLYTKYTQGMIFADLTGLTGDKGKEYMNKYIAAYNVAPNIPLYDGAAYDDVYLITQAISSVGDDSTKVAEYLRAMPSYTGVLGTYHFDKNGDLVGAGIVMQKVSGNKVIEL